MYSKIYWVIFHQTNLVGSHRYRFADVVEVQKLTFYARRGWMGGGMLILRRLRHRLAMVKPESHPFIYFTKSHYRPINKRVMSN